MGDACHPWRPAGYRGLERRVFGKASEVWRPPVWGGAVTWRARLKQRSSLQPVNRRDRRREQAWPAAGGKCVTTSDSRRCQSERGSYRKLANCQRRPGARAPARSDGNARRSGEGFPKQWPSVKGDACGSDEPLIAKQCVGERASELPHLQAYGALASARTFTRQPLQHERWECSALRGQHDQTEGLFQPPTLAHKR